MNIHSKVIPFELLPQGFIEAFVHYGADLKELLKNTGIHQDMLGRAGHKISYTQQTQLIRNGIDLCRRPGLGILVGQYMDWSYNGTVGEVVHCSPSMKAAGEAFIRYIMIAQPNYSMYAAQPNNYVDKKGLVVSPIRFFVSKAQSVEMRQFEIEYRLTIALRLLDECGNKSVAHPEVYVALEYPKPRHWELYNELPCHSVEFSQPQSHIAVHYEFLIKSFREMRKPAFDRVIARCEEEYEAANLETSYSAKVRWHLGVLFQENPSLEHIAEILSMSPRGLTRRLAEEGTSFRQLHHECRMGLVSHHLRVSSLSVEEIADIMGFANASSLRRAVKNWTGEAVSVVRAQGVDTQVIGDLTEDEEDKPQYCANS